MYRIAVLSALFFCVVDSARNGTLKALWNLERMAECRLKYTALAYNDYGCWCGVGGCCTPVDGIDHCCMNHDHCYDQAIDKKVCFDVPWEYVDDYTWTCKDGEPICSEEMDDCKKTLCWCDKQVVDCWAQYPKPDGKKTCTHEAGFLAFLRRTWASFVLPSSGTK